MKTYYFYVVLFGYAGFSAEEVTIVKANSLKDLANKGFTKNKDRSIYRFNSEEDAEKWAIKNNEGFPKNRIKFWT